MPAREEEVVRALSDVQLIRHVIELRHALDLVERHTPHMREKYFSHVQESLDLMEGELRRRGHDPASHPTLTRDEHASHRHYQSP